MFVRPLPGVLIRDPVSKLLLPPEGRRVAPSGFWARRLSEGSVEVVERHLTPDIEAAQPAPKKDRK